MRSNPAATIPKTWPMTWLLLAGCPVQVDAAAVDRKPPAPAPIEVDEKDPRVVRDGEDLYAVKAHEDPGVEGDTPTGLGTGKPDESNGYCRLYAPKLKDPVCCKVDYGFDAAIATEACGHKLYLGESFQMSCGYYFHDQAAGIPAWMRTSFVEEANPKRAAESHINRLRVRLKVEDAEVREVDGVPGAYWSTHDGLAWAWIPGWDKVRLLSWRETTCAPAGISTIVKTMIAARPQGKRERRLGIIPQARK